MVTSRSRVRISLKLTKSEGREEKKQQRFPVISFFRALNKERESNTLDEFYPLNAHVFPVQAIVLRVTIAQDVFTIVRSEDHNFVALIQSITNCYAREVLRARGCFSQDSTLPRLHRQSASRVFVLQRPPI